MYPEPYIRNIQILIPPMHINETSTLVVNLSYQLAKVDPSPRRLVLCRLTACSYITYLSLISTTPLTQSSSIQQLLTSCFTFHPVPLDHRRDCQRKWQSTAQHDQNGDKMTQVQWHDSAEEGPTPRYILQRKVNISILPWRLTRDRAWHPRAVQVVCSCVCVGVLVCVRGRACVCMCVLVCVHSV